MTIEIIGEDDAMYRKKTCRNCGAILRFLLVDIKEHTHRDYSGVSDTYRYIECPRCKARVVVKQ